MAFKSFVRLNFHIITLDYAKKVNDARQYKLIMRIPISKITIRIKISLPWKKKK